MSWKLPGYVADELIGYGGSGEVWRGRVAATGEAVALKRLPITDADQAHAARAEAALLSTLDHPHLVGLRELVPVGDAVVLVLDLAGGGSLSDLLARRGRLAPGEVISALAPIGAALAYAHNEGVVHGDVSAANVLFTEAGLPLLADLGVARIIGDAAPARTTPAYVDPSVAAGCAPGASSDVFMLGAVAFHALTGTTVWSGPSVDAQLAQAAAGELGDLASRLAGVPADLVALLSRALSVEPYLRCTAAEFALDLRHSAEPTPVELSAGRARMPLPAAPAPETADADDPQAVGDLSRPAFTRPGLEMPLAHPSELTHGVRAALQRSAPPRRRMPVLSRRVLVPALLVLVGMGAATAAVVTWSGRDHASASAPARGLDPGSAPPSTRQVPAPSQAGTSLDDEAAGVLRGLDQLRERAFAQRDAALLAQVYVQGPLLSQDVVLLERVVPPGCRLVGVHTTYSAVHASRSGDRLVLAATARLAPSTLTCRATASASGAGTGPTALRIELVRQDGSYRIASQQTS